MASATSTKRRKGASVNAAKKKTAKRASLGAKSASAASSSAAKKESSSSSMQSSATATTKLAPRDALIGSEVRRTKTPTAPKAPKAKRHAVARTPETKPPNDATAGEQPRPVTPTHGKKGNDATGSAPPAKRHKADEADAGDASGDDKAYDRSEAARMGWERRRVQRAASESRRKAAKLGWERRRKGGGSAVGASAPDASPAAEGRSSAAAGKKGAAPASAAAAAAAAAASSKVGYSAAARRKAAKLGWEKRRNEKAHRATRTTSLKPPPEDDLPAPSSRRASEPSSRRAGKRSRRLAAAEDPASAPSRDDESRRVSDLVTHLRLSRGWMEFHPSSRHGSGTATRGYIPSSIASFIRDGSVSQGTVLDRGTAGVHYALDWEGSGGLKEMIDTFGEDFAPYPTEDMMERSRVPEWELGDDLPWREVEEAEKRNSRRGREEELERVRGAGAVVNGDEETEDILFVASILASLEHGAVADASDSKECKRDILRFGNGPGDAARAEGSPSVPAAAKSYDGPADGYSPDAVECETRGSPLSRLADAAASKGREDRRDPDVADEDVPVVETPCRVFEHWNFGL